MKLKIVDRKYKVGGKWIRFERMKGVKLIGYKLAIHRFEIRIYLN